MNEDYVVDPMLKAWLPRQSNEEAANHERSILANGPWPGSIIVGVIAGERVLVDGHNTLDVCTRNKLNPPKSITLKETFANFTEAKAWMATSRRRNTSPEVRDWNIAQLADQGMSERKISDTLGVNRETVHNAVIRLKKAKECIPEVQELMAAGVARIADAAAIADLPPDSQAICAARLQEGKAKTLAESASIVPAAEPELSLETGEVVTQAPASSDVCAHCETLLRKGLPKIKHCPECRKLKAERKAEGKGPTPVPRQPKPGSIKFDDKKITDEIGKLTRLFDDRATALNDKGPKHKATIEAMKTVEAAWRQWRASA